MIALPSTNHRFGGVDWAIVLVCGAVILAIGLFLAKRQRTTEEYFLAGRNQRPIVAGISLFAALFTLVAYVGVPGEVIQHGPVLVLGSLAALPFSYWVISRFLIPAFMRFPITSGYELLEKRLGLSVRIGAALTFVAVRLVWMALILYASATVLIGITGWSTSCLPVVAASIGFVAALYTLAGGIEAAMATAILEFVLLLLGLVLTWTLVAIRGGVGAWWPHEVSLHWDRQPWISADWHVRVTVATTLVSYFISTVCAGGSDQVAIQRYLTTRDTRSARRAVLFGHVAVGTILAALGIVGVALLGYYRAFPTELPPGFQWGQGGDKLFPYFLGHALPVGISGLLVSALLTSAVSGLSPSINSVITVVERDFFARNAHAGQRSEKAKLRAARWLSFGIGMTSVAGSFAISNVHGNLIEISGKTVNLFFYPMFGLFFFALFSRVQSGTVVLLAAAAGLASGLLVGFHETIFGGPPVSFQWIGPIALGTTLLTGIGSERIRLWLGRRS